MRITGTWADFPGATVDAAAAAGALSVTVDTTIDLDLADDETGWLVLAGGTTPFEYVAAEDDETTGVGTVTLAAGLPVALEVGDSLRVWDDEAGIETVNYKAQIADDDGGSFEAAFAEAPTVTLESLVGASVDVDDEDVITRIWGRDPTVDAEYVATPRGKVSKTTATSIASDSTLYPSAVTFDADWSTDHWSLVGGYLTYSGPPVVVVATASAVWAANSTGYRRISILPSLDAESNIVNQIDPDTSGVASRQSVTGIFDLEAGESLKAGVRQNSGGLLDLQAFEVRAVVVGYR